VTTLEDPQTRATADATAASSTGTSTEVQPAAPAGWYVDPAGCHEFRYWNGRGWTPGVADRGFVREDALPDQPCAPTEERVRPPLRAAAFGVAGLVAGFAADVVIVLGFRAWAPTHKVAELVVSQAALWAAMLSVVIVVSRRYGSGRIRRDFGLRARPADAAWGLLLAFLARLVAGVVALVVLLAAGRLGHGTSPGLQPRHLDEARLVLMCLFLVVGAPLIEELFFRGLLLRSFQTRLPVWTAVSAQAVLFSVSHVFSSVGLGIAVQLLGALLFGLAAGFVVNHFRRLGPTIFGHAFFNLVAAIALIVVST
jgi:membrane protease YdiL (CAAX protease family)